jgi:hypothetical protein
LFSIFDSGASLTTMIGCTEKYCRNFHAVVNMLMQAFGNVGNAVLIVIKLC